MDMKKNKNRFLIVILLSLLFQLPDALHSQEEKSGKNNLLFSENFENGQDKPMFKKWMSGAVADEKIEIVASDSFSGKQCMKISFTPIDGKYWYYLLDVDIVQEADADYVAEAVLKACSKGNINVKLYTTSSSYQDREYKKIKNDGYMETAGTLSDKNVWEKIRSAPYNKIKMLKNAGKDEPYVKFRGVIIAVDSAKVGVPVTIFVDDISIRKADDAEKAKFFVELQKKYPYTPKDYPIQTEHFYYGLWTHGLGTGYYDWNQYKELQSKKDRYLCAIEKMIECNADTMMSETYYPSQDMARIDDIVESAEIANTYGLSTIAQTYLTPYYKKEKTLADCQKSIDIVIPKLKATKGIVSYYLIDEPEPDERSLEYWIWGKKAINSIDPEKPVTGVRDTIAKVAYYGYTERIHCLDIYPLRVQGGGKKTYDMEGGSPLVIESFCDAAYLAGAKDLWMFNQSFFTAYPPQFRMPSPAEIRMMTYVSLAFGSKGLFYFSFLTPLATTTEGHEKTVGIYNDVYAPQYDFGKEVIRLGNIVPIYAPVLVGTSYVKDAGFLVEADTVAVESENKKAIGYGYNQGNAYGVLVCYNRSVNSLQEGKIKFPDDIIKGKKVFDLLKLQEIKLINNSLSLSFTAGDGAIFVIASEKDFATISQECSMRRFYSIKRRFDFYAGEAINAGISVADEMKSAENALKILKTDSLAAVTQMSDAYDSLNKKMESHPVLSSVKKHLRNIQDNYSAILTEYWPYIIDNWGGISLTKDSKWSLWTKQMIMISETYILIRNGLYAGKLNEALAIAEDADALSSAMKAACGVNRFETVDDVKINDVYNQARKNFSGLGMTVLKNKETKSRD